MHVSKRVIDKVYGKVFGMQYSNQGNMMTVQVKQHDG